MNANLVNWTRLSLCDWELGIHRKNLMVLLVAVALVRMHLTLVWLCWSECSSALSCGEGLSRFKMHSSARQFAGHQYCCSMMCKASHVMVGHCHLVCNLVCTSTFLCSASTKVLVEGSPGNSTLLAGGEVGCHVVVMLGSWRDKPSARAVYLVRGRF